MKAKTKKGHWIKIKDPKLTTHLIDISRLRPLESDLQWNV